MEIDNKQIVLANKTLYEGDVFVDLPHGYGKAEYKNGDVYTGYWDRGIRSGQGKLVYKNGTEWNGEFKNDKLWDGAGYKYYADSVYEGELKNGKKCGIAKLTWDTGDMWEGEFENDKPLNGKGKWCYADSVYYGEIKNGKMEGQGKLIWNDGGEWIGQFKEGKRWSGKGVDRFDTGDWYDGTMEEGQYHGFGKYVWSDGSTYEGDWLNGKKHGQGKEICQNGDVLEGDFVNGFLSNGSHYNKSQNNTRILSNGKETIHTFGQHTAAEVIGIAKARDVIFLISTIITAAIFLLIIHIYKSNYPEYEFNQPFNVYSALPIIIPFALWILSPFLTILGYRMKTRTGGPVVIMLILYLLMMIFFVAFGDLSDLEVFNQIKKIGLWGLRIDWIITSVWTLISMYAD